LLLRLAPLLLPALAMACFGFATEEETAPPNKAFERPANSSSLMAFETPIPISTPVPKKPPIKVISLDAIASVVAALSSQAMEALAAAEVDETATPDPTATPSAPPVNTARPAERRAPDDLPPTIEPLPGLTSPETQIFVDHNAIRDEYGLRRFRIDDTLMAIARARAETMASMGAMTHYNPDGSTVFDMMAAMGYPYATGSENIHYNWGYHERQSVHVAVEGWINSPGHFASMVDPYLGSIGIGIAQTADGTFFYSVVFSD
jgi:uncharacterized protein YkwD